MNYRKTECPVCAADTVTRSRRRGLIEMVLGWFFIFPYRCRMCARRFYIDHAARPARVTGLQN